MWEVVALSALTTFLLGVGNGAAGEIGKNLSLSVGALVRRTLGGKSRFPLTRRVVQRWPDRWTRVRLTTRCWPANGRSSWRAVRSGS